MVLYFVIFWNRYELVIFVVFFEKMSIFYLICGVWIIRYVIYVFLRIFYFSKCCVVFFLNVRNVCLMVLVICDGWVLNSMIKNLNFINFNKFNDINIVLINEFNYI